MWLIYFIFLLRFNSLFSVYLFAFLSVNWFALIMRVLSCSSTHYWRLASMLWINVKLIWQLELGQWNLHACLLLLLLVRRLLLFHTLTCITVISQVLVHRFTFALTLTLRTRQFRLSSSIIAFIIDGCSFVAACDFFGVLGILLCAINLFCV